MQQEFNKKLEEMLVVPFMVILYACLIIPLSIIFFQGYLWLKTDEWNSFSLINITDLMGIDLSVLHEPGWTLIKNAIISFLEWPLVISSVIFIFIIGWLFILIFCVFAELVFNREPDESNSYTDTSGPDF